MRCSYTYYQTCYVVIYTYVKLFDLYVSVICSVSVAKALYIAVQHGYRVACFVYLRHSVPPVIGTGRDVSENDLTETGCDEIGQNQG